MREEAILRDEMSLRDELNAVAPRLRRYARALATGHPGPCDYADDLVHATLMRALGARQIGAASDLVVRLYATVTQLNREVALSGQQVRAAGAGRPTLVESGLGTGKGPSSGRQTKLSAALAGLPLEARETLFLVGLEGFDYAAAARILRISRNVLITRLTQARAALDAALRTTPPAAQGRGRGPHLRLVT